MPRQPDAILAGRASVTFAVHGGSHAGREVTLGHGDIIGRLDSAGLRLDDVAVSEAHALVSLRKGGLQLLALRRRFEVSGRVVSEVSLRPQLRVALAPAIILEVMAVTLPEAVLGVCWEGTEFPLLHDAAGLVFDPEPSLRWKVGPDAEARLWRVGDGWRLELPGEGSRSLQSGDRWTLRGVDFEARPVLLNRAAQSATVSPQDPLTLVLFYDTVHLQAPRRPITVIGGNQARLISDLALARAPMSWLAVAEELWPDTTEGTVLRKRLDAMVARLRKKLRSEGFRGDLVRSSGRGLIELRLGPADKIVDRT